MTTSPELLSPAGTLRNMRFAFAYGADAIYAGQPRYSLRVRENDFKFANLETGIKEAHSLGRKFYLASNVAPHNAKVKTFLRDIEPVIELAPDALIMSDPGLIMLVRDRWPEMPIHLSVQANAVNWAAVKFWQRQGIERVILSRELSLDEIEEIRQQVPEMELEVFVHGALCMAYSGRCLLSGYINHRDPNQGTCTNACRWSYKAHPATTDASGDLIPQTVERWEPGAETIATDQAPTSELFLLEDPSRPGQLMPAWEDEHGTYIMNSKDLRAIEHVERLVRLGITSLKIEGRTKSHYYAARTAQVYRQAIDDAASGRPFNPDLLYQLDHLANRGYTEGFYRRHTHDAYQNYEEGRAVSHQQQFVAEAMGIDGDRLLLRAKNKFRVGDRVELMTPGGNLTWVLDDIQLLKNGQTITEVPGSDYEVSIPLPETPDPSTAEFGLLMKYF